MFYYSIFQQLFKLNFWPDNSVIVIFFIWVSIIGYKFQYWWQFCLYFPYYWLWNGIWLMLYYRRNYGKECIMSCFRTAIWVISFFLGTCSLFSQSEWKIESINGVPQLTNNSKIARKSFFYNGRGKDHNMPLRKLSPEMTVFSESGPSRTAPINPVFQDRSFNRRERAPRLILPTA